MGNGEDNEVEVEVEEIMEYSRILFRSGSGSSVSVCLRKSVTTASHRLVSASSSSKVHLGGNSPFLMLSHTCRVHG